MRIIQILIAVLAFSSCQVAATDDYSAKVWDAKASEWAIDKTIYKPNDLLFCDDCGIIKRGDGVHTYAQLPVLGGNSDKSHSDSVVLANAVNTKVNRTGDNMTGALGVQFSGANKHLIAMNLGGSSSSGSSSFGPATYYLGLGHREWGANTYRLIGFGFRYYTSDHYPAVIGYQETNTSSSTYGDLIFATRNAASNTAPSVRLRITGAGLVKGYFLPSAKEDLTTKYYVDSVIALSIKKALDTLHH